VEVHPPNTVDARQAVLHYQRRGPVALPSPPRGRGLGEGANDLTWLELRPQTGRTHQLRVQLASRGHPIYGDAKYGSIHPFGGAIALHARSLTFLHPVRYEPITLTAELPEPWRRFHPLGLPVKP